MTNGFVSLACVMLCTSLIAIETMPASALPLGAPSSSIGGITGSNKTVEHVQYRDGRRYRGNGYRRGNGGNIALGIGAAIIGGIVLSEAARAEHRSSHGSSWNRCAQTYRSFDPDTGTYTGYDGIRHTCPYLR